MRYNQSDSFIEFIKKYKKILIVCVCIAVFCIVSISSCNNSAKKTETYLAIPNNLKWDYQDSKLSWDAVKDAEYYVITVYNESTSYEYKKIKETSIILTGPQFEVECKIYVSAYNEKHGYSLGASITLTNEVSASSALNFSNKTNLIFYNNRQGMRCY